MNKITSHAGKCSWVGTIEELLSLNRRQFLDAMKAGNPTVSAYPLEHSQYKAWRDEFRHLRVQLAKLRAEYRKLHIAFEYVLPEHPDKNTGVVKYEKRPDVIIFSERQVLILEFKQREPPPYEGFAKETRGYLRLLEKWHPKVPRMTAKGALVLTKAQDFGKRFARVKAISPDRIPAIIRNVFCNSHTPYTDPSRWLSRIEQN
jgi:hypothetical protein